LGNIIVNGELQHLSAYSRPAFFINDNNEMNIDYVKLEYKVNLDGLLFWVKAINSEWKAEVKLYTNKYKGEIEESFEEYLFYVIEDSKIKKMNSKDFGNSEKLLIISKKYEKYLNDLKVGSNAEFEITYSENIKSNIKTLVEGGPILINDEYSEEMLIEEKRAYSNGIIYGKSPRTAFAIDNNNMVTFIVAEGYIDENSGLNYDGMQELLNLMGSYRKAIMFDGGGSSLFYYNGEIVNNGSERLRDYIPVFINIYPLDK
jgi:exopolysaccharide biosynthesis protein